MQKHLVYTAYRQHFHAGSCYQALKAGCRIDGHILIMPVGIMSPNPINYHLIKMNKGRHSPVCYDKRVYRYSGGVKPLSHGNCKAVKMRAGQPYTHFRSCLPLCSKRWVGQCINWAQWMKLQQSKEGFQSEILTRGDTFPPDSLLTVGRLMLTMQFTADCE